MTLTAIPNKGYQFVRWSDWNSSNPRTVTLTSSLQLTAIFEAQNNTISVSTNETAMGSVTGGGTYKTGEVATLTATANKGYAFVRWSDENTENPRKISVNESLNLIAEFEALENTITLSVNDETMGSVTGEGIYKTGEIAILKATPNENYTFRRWSDGFTANPREITVTEDLSLVAIFDSAFIDGHEYVDLGLPTGTLWATYNVGGDSPEDYGDYFAWGDISPKDDYSTSTSLNPSRLPLSNDAANANWGGDWRMPTKAQWDELLSECTWKWTTNYNNTGRKGYIVTSKVPGNTNSIFLPAAGYRYGTSLNSTGSYGYYWSSSYYSTNSSYKYNAYSLDFNSGSKTMDYNQKANGYSIRPVHAGK